MHVDNPANIPDAEVDAYVARAQDMIKRGELPEDVCRMELRPLGDGPDAEIDIRYYCPTDRGIERIARITGYLVGTVDRWNDAKRAELRDRTKHLSKKEPQP